MFNQDLTWKIRTFSDSFRCPMSKSKIVVSVEKVKKTDQNVVALLPPSELTDDTEYVIVGAHYDHIGYGEIGSLATKRRRRTNSQWGR